jgi:hypothetical protein
MAKSVDPAELEKAAKLVDAAVEHFADRGSELNEIAFEIRGDGKLCGGYGETGAYQQGLLKFHHKFETVLHEFIADETAFWMFLQGFHDRIQQSARTYRTTELENVKTLNQLAKQINPGEAE